MSLAIHIKKLKKLKTTLKLYVFSCRLKLLKDQGLSSNFAQAIPFTMVLASHKNNSHITVKMI